MARSFYVEVGCQASAVADELENHLDDVMEALHNEPGLEDADIGADLGRGSVQFCVYVDAEDAAEALRLAHVRVRSALHAVGHRTPGWDEVIRAIHDDEAETMVRPAALIGC